MAKNMWVLCESMHRKQMNRSHDGWQPAKKLQLTQTWERFMHEKNEGANFSVMAIVTLRNERISNIALLVTWASEHGNLQKTCIYKILPGHENKWPFELSLPLVSTQKKIKDFVVCVHCFLAKWRADLSWEYSWIKHTSTWQSLCCYPLQHSIVIVVALNSYSRLWELSKIYCK